MKAFIEKSGLIDNRNNFTPLSKEDKNNINNIYKSLISDNFIFVYRGQKKENLKKLFNENYGTKKFFDYLFMIGEKAKNYHFKKQDASNQDALSYLLRIDSNEIEVFQIIFERFKSIFSNTRISKEQRKFMNAHEKFYTFFLEEDNIDKFIKIVKNINSSERILLRDYYLFLLHTISSNSKKSLIKPLFVSTSTKDSVAKGFAGLHEGKLDEGIMLYYFIPEHLSKSSMSVENNNLANELCEQLNLPIYNETYYPEQFEVAIKGALFPHFIFGLFDFERDYFIINPHILKQSDISYILKKGLYIDQSGFNKMIEQTSYTGYVERNCSEKYSDKFLQNYEP
jgi:hypothetical protein